MYKVLIRPVFTYASNTWALSKINEGRLSLFERKVLRRIFGAKHENETWWKRYNCELYETFKEPNVVNYMKVKRIAWARYLLRMNNDRTLKKKNYSTPNQSKKSWKAEIAIGRWC